MRRNARRSIIVVLAAASTLGGVVAEAAVVPHVNVPVPKVSVPGVRGKVTTPFVSNSVSTSTATANKSIPRPGNPRLRLPVKGSAHEGSAHEVVVSRSAVDTRRPITPALGTGSALGTPPVQFGNRFFTAAPSGETRFVRNELVLFAGIGVPPDQLQTALRRLGLTILDSQNIVLLGATAYRVRIDKGRSVAASIRALARVQVVAAAQPNFIYALTQDAPVATVGEPSPAAGSAATGPEASEGDAAQYALDKLGMARVHRFVRGNNISVALIDSEVDLGSPELAGSIAEEFDAVGAVDKPHAHGTGMAGAIAAHRRLMGIAPAVRLYAVHAFATRGANPVSTTFSILRGLDWAAGKDVRVINMSFAGPRDPSMERVLKAADAQGIVLVAAAGNAGPKSPPLYPGADPDVIAVTATDSDDRLFSGANRGRYIAVAAPGVDVLVPAPDGIYQMTTGTSVASAEVSGVVALLLERNPRLTPENIRGILTSSARHLAGKTRDDDYGSGLVDPSQAISAAGDAQSVKQSGLAPK